jgi:hypothetical protein
MQSAHVLPKLVGIALLMASQQELCGQEKPAPPASLELQSMVRGLLARADAITSARIRYKRIVEISDRHEQDYAYSFFGADWVLRSIGGGVEMSRGNKSLEYLSYKQENGKIRHTASIGSSKVFNEQGFRLPTKIGTVWHDCTKQFIAKHIEQTRLGAPQSFEGRMAYALEWDVSEEEVFDAFHSIDDISRHGGTLRVFVIPEMGFISPLVEHWGSKGQLQHTYTSTNFREVVPGMFYPMNWEGQGYLVSGRGCREEFQIEKIDFVNRGVPAKDFVVTLPIGTQVHDYHADESVSFELTPDSPQLQRLSDIIECAESSRLPAIWQRFGAIAVLFVGALFLAMVFKRRKPSTQS